ncbi:MAG: hypothetical protein K0S10_3157 [Rubrobacteraceae bacterium]|jgi:hypothetical protein|nr:hypothetical protein [Rubrobacteraceae bacterium]
MTLHAKVKGDELDRQHLSVNPFTSAKARARLSPSTACRTDR